MSTKDKECTVNAAKNTFWRYFNLLISDYGYIYSFKKKKSFVGNIAVVTMAHLRGHCRVIGLSLCVNSAVCIAYVNLPINKHE